jgi:hypothetical protein
MICDRYSDEPQYPEHYHYPQGKNELGTAPLKFRNHLHEHTTFNAPSMMSDGKLFTFGALAD